jgi:hypothetical protein
VSPLSGSGAGFGSGGGAASSDGVLSSPEPKPAPWIPSSRLQHMQVCCMLHSACRWVHEVSPLQCVVLSQA